MDIIYANLTIMVLSGSEGEKSNEKWRFDLYRMFYCTYKNNKKEKDNVKPI